MKEDIEEMLDYILGKGFRYSLAGNSTGHIIYIIADTQEVSFTGETVMECVSQAHKFIQELP